MIFWDSQLEQHALKTQNQSHNNFIMEQSIIVYFLTVILFIICSDMDVFTTNR